MNKTILITALTGVLLLMLLLAWTPGISITEDLGRHLLLGRIISEQHFVPDTNYLTYTHPGFPFVNHHWLSEVILYQLYRAIGYNGLIIWKALMMAFALGIALTTILPRGGKLTSVPGLALFWLGGILAAVMMGYRAHIRPELITYLGVALYSLFFEKIRSGARWPRFAILFYALFWANSHIYFIFGVGMAAAFAIEQFINKRTSATLKREITWLAAIVAASCITPFGIKSLLFPFRIFSNYGVGVTENASPLETWATALNPMLIALPLLSGLVAVALTIDISRCFKSNSRKAEDVEDIGAWKPRIAVWLTAIAALAASWYMARSAPLLALTGLPVIGSAFLYSRSRHSQTRLFCLLCLLPLFLNIWLCRTVINGAYARVFPSPIAPSPFGFDDMAKYTRVRELKREFGIGGPVFSDYGLGSLVEYNLYPERGYVDNRPEAFPGSFWRVEFNKALALNEMWNTVRDTRRINLVFVGLTNVKEAYTQEMMRRNNMWSLIHLDHVCAVWIRNTPQNKPIIDKLQFTKKRFDKYERGIAESLVALPDVPWWRRQIAAQEIVYSLYSLGCVGEWHRIWPYLYQIHKMYPDFQIVHELMRVSVPAEELHKVLPVFERRAKWPLAAKQVLDWGTWLESVGRTTEARDVYSRGRLFFPLSKPLKDAVDRIDDNEYRRKEYGTKE